MLPIIVAATTTILSLAGLGYYLLALWSARAFQHQLRRPLPDFQPGVSILKPVKGLDPEMYASFTSHCVQQYQGPYEILFGVSSLADPAVADFYAVQATPITLPEGPTFLMAGDLGFLTRHEAMSWLHRPAADFFEPAKNRSLAAASEAVHVAGWSEQEVRTTLKIRSAVLDRDPLVEVYGCAPWEPWPPALAAARFLDALEHLQRRIDAGDAA